MKKSAIALLLGCSVLLAVRVPGADAQSLLLDYVGYDYEDPDPNAAVFGEVGSGYVSLGLVPGLFAPLVADTTTNQYTYYISGLVSLSRTVVGDFVIINYGPGSLSVYEDSKTTGTPADHGINPPNATAPASFIDGLLFVSGTLSGFQVVFNTNDNSGSYEGAFEVTGGSQLGNFPVNQRRGWTFAGATGNELNRPEGYDHQIDGQIFLDKPVPTTPTSWGRIKAQYR